MHIDFVQVGAHVGRGDRVYDAVSEGYLRSGILLEPLPRLFEELERNYAAFDGNFHLVQAALHPHRKRAIIRDVADVRGLPEWSCAIGSMKRAVCRKHRKLIEQECGRKPRFRRTRVPCISFPDLLRRYDVDDVGELHVDAEGMDGAIVRSFPFDRILPRRVVFEYIHLGHFETDRLLHHLHELGYGITRENGDVIAVLA